MDPAILVLLLFGLAIVILFRFVQRLGNGIENWLRGFGRKR